MKTRPIRVILVTCVAAALLMVVPATAYATPPTVNGLFYGDGDHSRYFFLTRDTAGRADVYYYLAGNALYLLVLVDDSVNDNVFGWSKKHDPDRAYVESAGWGQEHSAEKLIGSDHLGIRLSCGSNSWSWYQDYAYNLVDQNDPTRTDWRSDPYGPDAAGGGSPPPGLISSASSLQWNLNHSLWDMTLGDLIRNDNTKWKSVDADDDDDVTDEDWPTYNHTYAWEWAMAYEMSMRRMYALPVL